MNLIIGVIVLIVCTFIGYRLSQKYKLRRVFYDSFVSFNKRVVSEVSFAQLSLVNIVKEYSEEKNDFYKAVGNYFIEGKDTGVIMKYLSESEIKSFKNYISVLGNVDKNTQLNFLNGVQPELDEKLKNAVEEEKKYRSLYIKLGFLFGLIALVILL